LGENDRVRALLVFVLLTLPVFAERVRVVVAFDGAAPLHGERWGDTDVYSLVVERGELGALQRDPRVVALTIDEGGQGGLAESIPRIGANVLRQQGVDGRGQTIAVLDTGIDTDHPDFSGRIVAEQCFCYPSCCPGGVGQRSGPGAAEDDHGHGTHVTSIAAGGGAVAEAEVAPAAQIVALKVMDSDNKFGTFKQIFDALMWIEQNHPEVDAINMSLGSFARYTPEQCGAGAVSLGLQPVIARLRQRGVLIAACTGNDAAQGAMWLPACMDEVLGVGSTRDNADTIEPYTNTSASMDIVAPGSSITASRVGGGVTPMSGTSMATPHVAGTILLIRQVSGHGLSADFLTELLRRTGKPVLDTRVGLTFPRLDALAAVSAAPRPPEVPRRRTVRH
jgi:subtilisin family serine protease